MNARQKRTRTLRLITSVLFIIIAITVLVASLREAIDASSIVVGTIAAIAIGIATAQPVVGVIEGIINFFTKDPNGEIPADVRDALLANQRRLWIDGILKRSIVNDLLIVPYDESDEKFKARVLEKVKNRLAKEKPARRRSMNILDKYKTVVDAYEASGEQLVILGEGGSGKTIALLQLLNHLYEVAKKDSNQNIPIVFNLGSWEEKQLSMNEWLVSELLDSFKELVSQQLSKILKHEIERRRIIFLFDGFDEISKSGRQKFYEELQTFLSDVRVHSTQFALCSRPEEFLEAQKEFLKAQKSKKLNIKTIRLRKIDDDAIEEYLSSDDYNGIRAIVRKRRKYNLYEPAHLPFILTALATGYRNAPEEDIAHLEAEIREKENMIEVDGLHPVPRVVLERYISQQFERANPQEYERYGKEKTTNMYLSWIAQKLGKNRSEVAIENIQPTWLDKGRWRFAYMIISRMLGAAAITSGVGVFLASPLDYLPAGMLAGIIVGLLDTAFSRPALTRLAKKMKGAFLIVRLLTVYLACALVLSVYLGLFTPSPKSDRIFFSTIALSGITLAWFLSLFIAIIYTTRDIRLKLADIEPVEILELELRTMVRYGLIGGISVGAFIGVFAQALLAYGSGSTAAWLNETINRIGGGWAGAALIGFLVGGFFGSVFIGLFGVLTVQTVTERTRPNQGIRTTMFNALRVGVTLTVIFGGILGMALWLYHNNIDGLYRGIRNGLAIGILGGLWYGGIVTIHHYVLRFFFVVSGRSPWDISNFLHYCSQINIMREIGASYIFSHDYVKTFYLQSKLPADQTKRPMIAGAFAVLVIVLAIAYTHRGLNTLVYSFRNQEQILVNGPTNLPDKTVPNDRKVYVKSGDKYKVLSVGLIRTGDYMGYITPEGSDIGFFGIPVGDTFDIVPQFINNALLCKLDTEEEWHSCANPPASFALPWTTRESDCFEATRDGYLQFEINDHEVEKRRGQYFVMVEINPDTCRETDLSSSYRNRFTSKQ